MKFQSTTLLMFLAISARTIATDDGEDVEVTDKVLGNLYELNGDFSYIPFDAPPPPGVGSSSLNPPGVGAFDGFVTYDSNFYADQGADDWRAGGTAGGELGVPGLDSPSAPETGDAVGETPASDSETPDEGTPATPEIPQEDTPAVDNQTPEVDTPATPEIPQVDTPAIDNQTPEQVNTPDEATGDKDGTAEAATAPEETNEDPPADETNNEEPSETVNQPETTNEEQEDETPTLKFRQRTSSNIPSRNRSRMSTGGGRAGERGCTATRGCGRFLRGANQ